jgi:N utilization substance protein B
MNTASQKPSPAARRKARRFTVQALYQWQMTGANLGEIETQFRVDNDMRKTDVAYFHELLHEIPKCVNELDETFRPLLDREIKDLDRVELAILRIGTYELSKRPDVPFKVAINEGIELAKYFGATESHKYVNGILDKVAQRLRVAEMKAGRDKPQKNQPE